MSVETIPPRAFISYSHDSPFHKDWVRALAQRLTRDGVDVVLDQWDLSVGDELPRFMERSLAESDFVILICTEAYADKANERVGGVGYEATILSDLLLRQAPVTNDGSSRVIPVLRQSRRPPTLPRFASGRLYVDLSDVDNGTNYEDLLRVLHNAPRYTRPAIGPNPFAVTAVLPPGSPLLQPAGAGLAKDLPRALRAARSAAAATLVARQSQYPFLAGATAAQRDDELSSVIATHAGYLEILVRAAQVDGLNANLFSEEIEHLVTPAGWSLSGSKRVVELPYAIGWAAHHLVGAALLDRGGAGAAVQYALERVQVSPGARYPVFAIGRLTGWPVHGGNSYEAWGTLRRLPEHLPWISEAFGGVDDFWVAIVSHAIALNYTEFLSRVQHGPKFDVIRQDREHAPKIPLYFWNEGTEVQRRAFRLLIRDLAGLAGAMGMLASVPNLHDLWSEWIRYQQSWVSIESGGSATGTAPHGELLNVLISGHS
jgi:hypothetical protein